MRLLLDTHTLLLIAQAMVEAIPIISNDPALDAYGITRLWQQPTNGQTSNEH